VTNRRDRPDLAAVLKARRKEMGLTLGDLGAALGLANGNFFGMVERNERMPSDERLLLLAKLLGLDGRELLAMKYQQARGTAAKVLLAPPPPQLPRLRRLLIGCCENKEEMASEFALGERSALERVVLQALLEYVFLPALSSDRYAPKGVRDRVRSHQRRSPGEHVDPWILEEEAESFAPWAREQLVSWSFDVPNLTLRIRHSDSPGDLSTIPLVDRELRRRMMASVEDVAAAPAPPVAVSLGELLADKGLSESDVEEILELVEFKKMRASRSG
jgi:transcriptional regulator with XRE-family HTH domain